MTSPTYLYPQMPTGLPDLEPELLSHLNAHIDALRAAIQSQPEGFLPFDQFMQLCLYAPQWGYYTAGSTKFGSDMPTGDFTDRKSTRLNSSHVAISYAVFCLKK